ncbi:MAG: HAD hydrolase-like protein [Spirochaetales bacterium]|nr:HAD hydrolase-like protein [Spirochaetales bacterium]
MKRDSLLVLWDVDLTLLDTHWTDKRAMAEAGRELIGRDFDIDGVDMAGTLDPNIWRDIAAANGVEDPDGLEGRYRAAYLARLKARETEHPVIHALPGARELVARLGRSDRVVQGVLSGNYPEIGHCKLTCAGIDKRLFVVYAWGTDGRERRELFPAAFERAAAFLGRPVDPGRVVIIGDTLRDVECAREFGCRMLAVATGRFSAAELEAAGADKAVTDLTETEGLASWIEGS